MFKYFFIIAMLSGWLIVELKDLFSNGAMANPLALGLLRIIFLAFSINMFGGFAFFSKVVSYYFSTRDLAETVGDYTKDLTIKKITRSFLPKSGEEEDN